MNLFLIPARRCLLFISLVLLTGCEPQFIDKVRIEMAPEGKKARITLRFNPIVQTDLTGGLRYHDLAWFYVNPLDQPNDETVGFLVSTELFLDPELRKLAPVNTLANGIAIAVGEPLTEIRAEKPVSPKFGLYGYADMKNQTWAGTAVILSFHDPKLFPVGFSSRNHFMPDDRKNPGITAQLNGPILNDDGTVGRYATFSLFVNIKRAFAEIGPGKDASFSPMKKKKPSNH